MNSSKAVIGRSCAIALLLLAATALSTAAEDASDPDSVDKVAQDLANPNTPRASLNFKLQFRTFDGALPKADEQESATLLFQPTLPFPLDNGDLVLFRPALPVLMDTPVSDAQGFDSKAGLGDLSFDLAYASTSQSGLLTAFGIISSIPTATSDDLGTEQWSLGPEALIGYLQKRYILGAFPNHQWDIAGDGVGDVNLTTVQVFGIYLPTGGWSVGTTPIMTYDWEAEDWAIPLNFTLGRTMILGGRPWKLSAEVNYFVERSGAFGPQWFVGFNVTPVVENVFARMFQ